MKQRNKTIIGAQDGGKDISLDCRRTYQDSTSDVSSGGDLPNPCSDLQQAKSVDWLSGLG